MKIEWYLVPYFLNRYPIVLKILTGFIKHKRLQNYCFFPFQSADDNKASTINTEETLFKCKSIDIRKRTINLAREIRKPISKKELLVM